MQIVNFTINIVLFIIIFVLFELFSTPEINRYAKHCQ